MESNQLMADNVVSGSQAGGDLESIGLVGDESIRSPCAVRGLSSLCNLKPDSSIAWTVVCATRGTLGQVGNDRTVVAVWPCSPV